MHSPAQYCVSLVTALLDHDQRRGLETAQEIAAEVTSHQFLANEVILGLAALSHDYLTLFCMERGLDPTEVFRAAAVRTYNE